MVFYPHVFSIACKTCSYSLRHAFLWEKHMWPTLLLFIKNDVVDILIPHSTYLFLPSTNFSFSSTESQKNLMGSPSPLIRRSFSQVHLQYTNPSLNGNFCHRSQHGLSYQGCYRWNLCNVDRENFKLTGEIFLWQYIHTAELYTHFCIVPTLATRPY